MSTLFSHLLISCRKNALSRWLTARCKEISWRTSCSSLIEGSLKQCQRNLTVPGIGITFQLSIGNQINSWQLIEKIWIAIKNNPICIQNSGIQFVLSQLMSKWPINVKIGWIIVNFHEKKQFQNILHKPTDFRFLATSKNCLKILKCS